MVGNVWVELRNISGGLITPINLIEGRWSVEMVGGCGAASFTLAREWDNIGDLTEASEVRVMVDGDLWWTGIIESLGVADEQFPRIECAGYRERLRRFGSFYREWTTIDKGTSQDPGTQADRDQMLDLNADVGADVLSRFTGLFPDLTSSRNLTTRTISYATLEGDGYGVLDNLVALYGGDAIWGVDKDKVLYLKDFPSSPAPNMHFVYGRDFRLAFEKDSSHIANRIVLIGQNRALDVDVGLEQEKARRATAAYYAIRAPLYKPKVNPLWNLLPNASFEERRADVESQYYVIGVAIKRGYYENYSWVGIKATMDADTDAGGLNPPGFPSIRGSAYDPTAEPGKAGETAIRFEMWNPVATQQNPPCRATVSTAYGEVSAPNPNEDTRVPVVPGTDLRLSAAVYKVGGASVTTKWEVTDYNADDGVVATHTSPIGLELAEGWNTWATSQGGGGTSQGVGTDISETFTLALTAARVKASLLLYANSLATSQIVYVDAWQLQTTSQSQSFTPVASAVELYDVAADYMNAEESEIRSSKSDYGLHFGQVRAPFKDQRYANEADGLRYARGFFYNNAVPVCNGTLELLREPELYQPWDGLLRLHGLSSAVRDALRRFSSETFVDLQAERVEYTWDGSLKARISFASKKRVIPVAERGILDNALPPQTKVEWRRYLERISAATPGPHRYREPSRR